MKFYLPTLKHLVIQLAKLQIYTLNLTTTFWHCKKNPITFEQECTRDIEACNIVITIVVIDSLPLDIKQTRDRSWSGSGSGHYSANLRTGVTHARGKPA